MIVRKTGFGDSYLFLHGLPQAGGFFVKPLRQVCHIDVTIRPRGEISRFAPQNVARYHFKAHFQPLRNIRSDVLTQVET
jgi:hypothetical protein